MKTLNSILYFALAGFALALPAQSLKVVIGPATRYNDQFNGSNGLPNNGRYTEGDTGRLAWAANGNTYLVKDDSNGPQNVLQSTSGRNVSIYTLSSNQLQETLVNSMDSFGTMAQNNTNGWTDSASWKVGGLSSISGKLWLWVFRLTLNGSVYAGNNAGLVWSADNGATWCSHAHTDSSGNCTITASATGDPPTSNQSIFAPSTDLSQVFFVSYCQDGTITCLSGPVDGNDTWQYVWAMNAAITKSKLLRVRKTDKYHLTANYQYYTGGDGLDDANWSSSSGSAAIGIDVGTTLSGGVDPPLYVAQFNRWLLMAWDNNNNSFMYEGPHLWGPWTKINTLPAASLPFKNNYWNPVLSTLTAGSSGTTVSYYTSGSYLLRTTDPITNNYSPFIYTFTITRQVPATVSGKVSLRQGARVQ